MTRKNKVSLKVKAENTAVRERATAESRCCYMVKQASHQTHPSVSRCQMPSLPQKST